MACKRFLSDHDVLVEPACGASLAAVYGGLITAKEYRAVLIVVCGGVTANAEQLEHWQQQLEIKDPGLVGAERQMR